MTKATLVGLASLAVVASTVLLPDLASADGRHRFRGHSHRPRLHAAPPKHFPRPHHFAPRPFFHGHKGHFGHGHKRHFGGAPVIVFPSAPVYAPRVYTPAPVYVPVPTYVPSPTYVPAPTERVVEFETGRYELHGDGITTPYRWVWIPKPPVAPPDEEPVAPDAAPDASSPAPSAAPARTRPIEVYRWTDDHGVVHLTDRLDNVPEAYRARVTKLQSASAKKGRQ